MKIKFMITAAAVITAVTVILFILAGKENVSTATGSGNEEVALPIIMYHSVCVNTKVDSEYYMTPEAFEEDMKYLCSHGYKSVFLADAVRYVKNGTPLPEKPVIISIDDGYYNVLENVLPVLEKYGMKANVNIVGEYADEYSENGIKNAAYSYLSWESVKELADSGRIETGSHTYAMHRLSPRKGCSRMATESAEHYKKALTDDLTALNTKLKENCGIDCKVFAYPYGELCDDALPVLTALGFEAALTCSEHVNRLTREPAVLMNLGRINRNSRLSTSQFMSRNGIE